MQKKLYRDPEKLKHFTARVKVIVGPKILKNKD